jgi:subtilase family serine protease
MSLGYNFRRSAALSSTALCALAAAASLGAGVARAEPSRPLITTSVDESRLVEVSGNIRPEVSRSSDLGKLPDSTKFDHIYLQLQRSPERETALKAYLETLNTKGAANYHKWLSPEAFDRDYGPDAHDRAVIEAWLGQHGITVNAYTVNMVLDVSATAAQLKSAFGVDMHNIRGTDGRVHYANINEPSVPAALRPALLGPASLSNFMPHPMLRRITRPVPSTQANYTISSSLQAVAPGDLQTIYNITPLYTQGITGAGQTIGLIEDIDMYNTNDWNTFRKIFGLSRQFPQGSLTVLHPSGSGTTYTCTDPGHGNSADGEASLDVEWASAAAPNAALQLISCADTSLFGGFVAMQNMLTAGTEPKVMSLSYGEGETQDGASLNATINTLYQALAAAGVSLFVSSGDAVSNQADRGAIYATHGIVVSGWASTAYNVSVGGTDFGDTYLGTVSNYWNSTNAANFSSAKSYIPEIPWNNTCASQLYYTTLYNESVANGGSLTEAAWTGSIAGTALTVTAVSGGTVYDGLTLVGKGITAATTITSFTSGTAGGVGKYVVSKSQTVASEAMSGTISIAAPTAVAVCNNLYLADLGGDEPAGGAGGPSNCATGAPTTRYVASGTCKGYAKPSWQSGTYGNPADTVRDQPDVALFASNGFWGHYYPYCFSDPTSGFGGASCTNNPSTWSGAGGTSFSSPIMAGIQALVNQKNGSSMGNVAPILYTIGKSEFGASGNASCSAEATGGPSSTCVFNDSQLGDISSACGVNGRNYYNCDSALTGATYSIYVNSQSNSALSPSTTVGAFGTTSGWDFATGLGSPNVTNLVNNPNW